MSFDGLGIWLRVNSRLLEDLESSALNMVSFSTIGDFLESPKADLLSRSSQMSRVEEGLDFGASLVADKSTAKVHPI